MLYLLYHLNLCIYLFLLDPRLCLFEYKKFDLLLIKNLVEN